MDLMAVFLQSQLLQPLLIVAGIGLSLGVVLALIRAVSHVFTQD